MRIAHSQTHAIRLSGGGLPSVFATGYDGTSIMAHGDGGKAIFVEKEDYLLFLHGLSRVCGSHGWRVRAWMLMGNHYHLFIETPEPNRVAGMMTAGQPSSQIFYLSDFNRHSCYLPPVERR